MTRRGHHMLAHLRTEAYPIYSSHQYPPLPGQPLSFEENVKQIEIAKTRLDQHLVTTRTPL
jgi:hypothetical protein